MRSRVLALTTCQHAPMVPPLVDLWVPWSPCSNCASVISENILKCMMQTFRFWVRGFILELKVWMLFAKVSQKSWFQGDKVLEEWMGIAAVDRQIYFKLTPLLNEVCRGWSLWAILDTKCLSAPGEPFTRGKEWICCCLGKYSCSCCTWMHQFGYWCQYILLNMVVNTISYRVDVGIAFQQSRCQIVKIAGSYGILWKS